MRDYAVAHVNNHTKIMGTEELNHDNDALAISMSYIL